MSGTYWLERAWLGSGTGVATGVLVTVRQGRFVGVEAGAAGPPPGALRLDGLTVPGMANCHSHAFHRALRGRTQRGRGTFWTWREQMYALAERLTPDTYLELARAAYREMVAAGFTAVGEFHYLHHGPGGRPYDDPNEMGRAMVQAAGEAGIRITLLDACYLAAGIGSPAEGVQLRFSDRTAEAWAARVEDLAAAVGPAGPVGPDAPRGPGGRAADPPGDVVVGAAIHSVRAVPRGDLAQVAGWAARHHAPLHAHLSEQVAENAACLAAYGITPTELLAESGALTGRATAVHATHLTDADVTRLGAAGSYACFCPTTERDLGDGIGPSRGLAAAGARLTLGTDSHAVVDAFEEMRAVELDERLARQERGHWSAEELLTAATSAGHTSLGFEGAGRIAVGAPADLVTLDTASPATAGTGASPETAVFAAGASDVVHVVAGGRVVATGPDRAAIGRELDSVIARIWGDA